MSEDCRHEGGDADARGQGKQVGQDRVGENADRIGRLSGNARQKSKVQHQLDEHDDQLAEDEDEEEGSAGVPENVHRDVEDHLGQHIDGGDQKELMFLPEAEEQGQEQLQQDHDENARDQ